MGKAYHASSHSSFSRSPQRGGGVESDGAVGGAGGGGGMSPATPHHVSSQSRMASISRQRTMQTAMVVEEAGVQAKETMPQRAYEQPVTIAIGA